MKNKKKNPFGYISILGLLGISGFVTGLPALFLFFGYFGYAYYFRIIPDEMFKEHLLKAAAMSFLLTLLSITVLIILVSITENMEFASTGLFISFIIANISFAVIHTFYEIREEHGLHEKG
jgi:hypothetical protein